MDVKGYFLGLAVAAAAGSTAATAAQPYFDAHMQTLAPVVTAASCNEGCTDCPAHEVGVLGCDSCGLGTGCGLGGCDSCGFDGCDSYGFGGCDSCGGGGCGSCGNDDGLFGFGLIKRSDRCFDDFISPMTNPVFFEDPRTLSEVRFIFLNHELPAALGGNSVQVYAMQVRAALTERLSLIATKDGLIYTQSPVL